MRAAVELDPVLIRQAMLVDPATSAQLTVGRSRELADAMVTAHGDLLPLALQKTLG